MDRNITNLAVFIASPMDVAEERDAVQRAVERVDRMLDRPRRVRLQARRWETLTRPGVGLYTQDVVNSQLGEIAPYDIFIGIFADRLGTPTPQAASGTIEEFESALRRFREAKRPSLMMYVSATPVERSAEHLRSALAVEEFSQRLDREGLLHWRFEDVNQLEHDVVEHLNAEVREMMGIIDARRSSDLSPREERAGTGGADGDEDDLEDIEDDLLELRLKLEAKLAWLCKHLLAGPDTATFATIGSLAHDGYLKADQARLLTRILAGRVGSTRPAIVRQFVADAKQTVGTFRAIVFDAHVRKLLDEMGWAVIDFEQPPTHRPDFLAVRAGRAYRISPRLITSRKSEIREQTARRLRKARDEPRSIEGSIIVIPDATRAQAAKKGSPRVVKVKDLQAVLSTG
jgi:hypothetical protein